MMKNNFLKRPEYIFQPKVTIRRFLHRQGTSTVPYSQQSTPWKASVRYKTGEEIGRSLELMGIYDLSVSEVLWRLAEPGDFVCDVGANVGYTASLLASRVGKTGKVICFEPHPEIYKDLEANADNWRNILGWTQVECKSIALSDNTGVATLYIPAGFAENRGIATLSEIQVDAEAANGATGAELAVQIDTLDNILKAEGRMPSLVKVDVEGHEISVFRGASECLKEVRDIVFEEHDPHPAKTTLLLQEDGFKIYRILKSFLGPVIVDPASEIVQKMSVYWEPANYLATRDSDRAEKFMKKRGWACLRG